MKFRFLKTIGVYTVLGTVCTLFLAFARCGLANWAPLRLLDSKRTTTTYGVGPLNSDDRTAWSWSCISGRGEVFCASFIVDEDEWKSNQARPTPDRYRRGVPPWWTSPRERPTPPSVMQFHYGRYPKALDVGFGWPIPCVAERIESFIEVPVSPEHEQLIRSSPTMASIYPTGQPIYDYPPQVAYGAYQSTWLNEQNLHDGYWPTRVLWRGLLVDATVWSCVLAIPRFLRGTVRAVRREKRRRQGCCVYCGYTRDGIGSSVPCPECGRQAAGG